MATSTLKIEKTAPPIGGPDLDLKGFTVQNIPVGLIVPSPTNERRDLDQEFIASIRRSPVHTPILLRPRKATAEDIARIRALPGSQSLAAFDADDKVFEIVYGQRRWEGTWNAGRTTVPAIVRDMPPDEALEIQIVENDHRKDLKAMQRCRAYQRWIEMGMSPQEIAVKVSREARTVYQIIALKNLVPEAQSMLAVQGMEDSHAYEISRRPKDEQQRLCAWMRTEAEHSQGDMPSVRRLKREIKLVQAQAEEARSQKQLFESEPPAEKTPTAAPRKAPAPSKTPAAKSPAPKAPASVKSESPTSVKSESPIAKAAAKAASADADKKRIREQKITAKADALVFRALVSRATIDTTLLRAVIPDMLFDLWESGVPVESFAPSVLKWPAPKKNSGYEVAEVRSYCRTRTAKFTRSLLAALLVNLVAPMAEGRPLLKHFKVKQDVLRKAAAAQIAEEERKAAEPRTPTTKMDKQLYHAVDGDALSWRKLRRNGASDFEIRNELRSMGTSGFHSKEVGDVCFQGGTTPRVWLNSITRSSSTRRKPLEGQALIAAIRDLLNIPQEKSA